MSEHVCVEGCRPDAHIARPAGSSVPEAARAAAWISTLDERRRRWEGLLYGRFMQTRAINEAMALADLEVAAATSAAVAEERATTGRRIEAIAAELRKPLQSNGGLLGSRYQRGWLDGRYSASDLLRAALASPGEGE